MPITLRQTALAAALLLPALGACVNITGTDDLSREQSALDRNWDRFQRNAPLSYSYVVRVSCECVYDISRPVVVWVDRGNVEYLYYQDTGEAVPYSYSYAFPSAEQLFDIIQNAIDRRADRIDVDYDYTYGYPTSVYIDYDRRVADEETAIDTWGLQRWD